MTDPAVSSLTLTLLQALVWLGVAAALVGIVAVSTALSPRPAPRPERSNARPQAARPVAAAH